MKMLMAAACAAMASVVFAEGYDEVEFGTAYFQACFASPLHLPSSQRDVKGVRWDILWGDSHDVTGLDFGLVGRARGNVAGCQLGLYEWNEGFTTGLQLGAVGAYQSKDFDGVQVCGLLALNDQAETHGVQLASFLFDAGFTGLQMGLLEWNFGAVEGCQIGAVNVNRNDQIGAAFGVYNRSRTLYGGQIGVFNTVDTVSTGFQLGLVNCASNLTGVQVGLVNINQGARLQMMTVFNANF